VRWAGFPTVTHLPWFPPLAVAAHGFPTVAHLALGRIARRLYAALNVEQLNQLDLRWHVFFYMFI
jgi:hypothetical protein